jgi:outer membrane protein assembly factor BamB
MIRRLTLKTAGAAVVAIGLGGTAGSQTNAADWPQWRGPNRDGHVAGFSAPTAWPDRLTERWRADVGSGYATPLLVGGRIYMFSRQGEHEVMAALDAASGKVLWRTSYPAPFKMDKSAAPHGAGPKSTPAFADGKLFSIGMSGIVTAFDAATGKQLWQKPGLPAQPLWTSHSFSPLVDQGRVVFHMGGNDAGTLSAFDVDTGAAAWSWSGDGPGYGSPMLFDFAGTRQIVTMTQQKFIGLDAATGRLLWERPYTTEYAQNIITPVRRGDTLIVSGYQKPMTAFRVVRRDDQWSTEPVWENADVSLYMSDPVLAGDTLFGFSQRRSGQFFALDASSGKTLWTSDARQGTNASIVSAGDFWFALKDDGELLVSRRDATSFAPLRRYQVAKSATWAPPVVAGNRIFVKDVSTLTLWTFESAQAAGPVAPALTPEQIRASQALAPKFDRAAAMEQARQATFKDRPLGAIVQKSFNAFANYLIVSAQMMPEPGYAFRPTPDVRAFGEQINHATGANYSFCNQAGVPPGFERRTAPNLQGATSKAAIVKALEDSIAYCTSLLAAASDAWLMESAPNLGGAGSGVITGSRAYAFIYAGIHSAEDYGTITTYLRMQGVVPPSTALSRP